MMKSHLQKAIFLGSKSLGLKIFEALLTASPHISWHVIHPDDTQDERSNLLDFKAFADEKQIDFTVCATASLTKQKIAEIVPDIGFVCGWYQLFDGDVLQAFPSGLWGIHNSLLPRYRGGSPLVWSIIQGDDVVGSSVFKITEGLDDGPILGQVQCALGADDTVADVLQKLELQLVNDVPSMFTKLMRGQAVPAAQDSRNATYCGLRRESDGQIDWQKPAQYVHNFIRAQSSPYPCAFTFSGAQKMKIKRARFSNDIYLGTPGQVLRRTDHSVFVSCGQNTAIELLSVIVDGQEYSARTFIKSIHTRFSFVVEV